MDNSVKANVTANHPVVLFAFGIIQPDLQFGLEITAGC
jgi:hypothetical protein